jgi:cyclin-dependent kinase 2
MLGTPTETMWPEICSLPYWRNTFPEWESTSWSVLTPTLPTLGQDLLSVNLYIYKYCIMIYV